MILKGLESPNEHRGIAISAPIGFSTRQVNDVSHEFPFLALVSRGGKCAHKKGERQRRGGSTEEGPLKRMVFSKDAYSSGRCETASEWRRRRRNEGREFEPGRLYLLIFFRAFLKGNVASVVVGRKNAQLFRRLA